MDVFLKIVTRWMGIGMATMVSAFMLWCSAPLMRVGDCSTFRCCLVVVCVLMATGIWIAAIGMLIDAAGTTGIWMLRCSIVSVGIGFTLVCTVMAVESCECLLCVLNAVTAVFSAGFAIAGVFVHKFFVE